MAPGRVVDQVGNMVVYDKAPEADLLELTHDSGHIAIALVNKALGKILGAALHVPHMDIEDPSLSAKVFNGFQNPLSAPHLRPAAMAEVQAMHRAGMGFHRPAE